MDHFAGLDVSVKETSVCIVDEAGKVVREVKVAHSSPAMPVSATFTRIPCRTIGGRCACSISWAFPAPSRASAT